MSDSQLPTVGLWCHAIAAAEHKNGQTERNTFWDVQPVQIMLLRWYFRPLHSSLAAALSTDCRRSCKRRDIPMRFTLP